MNSDSLDAARAAAIAEARAALHASPRPRAQQPAGDPPPRAVPAPLTSDETLQHLLAAIRDTRRALAALEAALTDYTHSKEGTSPHD